MPAVFCELCGSMGLAVTSDWYRQASAAPWLGCVAHGNHRDVWWHKNDVMTSFILLTCSILFCSTAGQEVVTIEKTAYRDALTPHLQCYLKGNCLLE